MKSGDFWSSGELWRLKSSGELWSRGTERAESLQDSVRWAKPESELRSRESRVEVVKVILVLRLTSTREVLKYKGLIMNYK